MSATQEPSSTTTLPGEGASRRERRHGQEARVLMTPDDTLAIVASIDPAVDHVRGPADGHLIIEYGDYECPYSRAAFRAIQTLGHRTRVRFAFRHFPLTAIHPRALAAASAAEAAALQDRFWEMSEVLFGRQRALGDRRLRNYATELGLDLPRFDADRMDSETLARIRRDVRSGLASRQVRGTPTLFVDGVLYSGRYDARSLCAALGMQVHASDLPEGC